MPGKVFGSAAAAALPDALRVFDPQQLAFWCGLPDAGAVEAFAAGDVTFSEHTSRLLVACAGVARLADEAAQQAGEAPVDLACRRVEHVRARQRTAQPRERLDALGDVMRLLDLQISREPLFDEQTVEVFTEGDCHHLAGALHGLTGLPMCAMLRFGDPDLHVYVQLPDGRFLDVTGPAEPELMCRQWGVPDIGYTSWPVPYWDPDPSYAEPELIAEVAAELADRYAPMLAA